jgi:hypothetical protein
MEETTNNELPSTSTFRTILPLPQALVQLVPNCRWHLEGYHYEGLVWEDAPELKPSKETVETLAQQILDAVPLKELRRQRDKRFQEVDWVTLKAARTGEPISQEWLDYMTALADITDTHPSPKMENGRLLDITWPERPDGVPAGPYKPGMFKA